MLSGAGKVGMHSFSQYRPRSGRVIMMKRCWSLGKRMSGDSGKVYARRGEDIKPKFSLGDSPIWSSKRVTFQALSSTASRCIKFMATPPYIPSSSTFRIFCQNARVSCHTISWWLVRFEANRNARSCVKERLFKICGLIAL